MLSCFCLTSSGNDDNVDAVFAPVYTALIDFLVAQVMSQFQHKINV